MKSLSFVRRVVASLTLFAATTIVCGAQTPPPVRILPLGDSITEGCCSGTTIEGGYRTRLEHLLEANGYNVDFVGTLTDPNPPEAGLDSDHEGHSGFLIEDMENGVASWLDQVEDPDVILLHAGTNDFWSNRTLSETQDNLRSLLAALSTLRPYAKIVVASLIPRTDSHEAIQVLFNESLPDIVAEQVALGRNVVFWDMHGPSGSEYLSASDLADGVHPNPGGYDKMGDRWYACVSGIITPLGTSDPPALVDAAPGIDRHHASVRFSKPIKDEDAIAANFQLDGGEVVLDASLDAATKRIVTLHTEAQQLGTVYTVTVNNVRDRTPEENTIAPGSTDSFTSVVSSPVPLVNGGFETGTPADFGSLDGWTVTADPGTEPVGFTSTGTGFVPPYNPNEGLRMAIFNNGTNASNGSISQSFDTTSGTTYQVELDLGIVADIAGRVQRLGVLVQGSGVDPIIDVQDDVTSTGAFSYWAPRKSYQFVADGPSATLVIYDASGSLTTTQVMNSDLLVDDVTVTGIISSNTPPVVDPQSVSLPTNGTLDITLTGSDVDAGDTLTFGIVTGPDHGTVDLFGEVATYTPDTDYSGPDSFTFRANDGTADSDPATINISVIAPTSGFLANGGFELGSPADYGSLDGWTVTADAGSEPVGFTSTEPGFVPPFTPNEGLRMAMFNNGAANYSGAISQTFVTVPGTRYAVELDLGIVADVAGRLQKLGVVVQGDAVDPLVNSEETVTSTGALTFWAPRKSYQFTADGNTTTLTLYDASGSLTSPQTQNSDLLLDDVKVVEVINSVPLADPQTVTMAENTVLDITLTGSDADPGDTLTFAIASGPTHGTVDLVGAVATYTPDTDYNGSDSFTFTVNDGTVDSTPATVGISVTAPADGFLVNGGFELGSPADFGSLDGWAVTADAGSEPVGFTSTEPGFVPPFTPNEGFRMAMFNNGSANYSGAISQTFTTVPGTGYAIELDLGIVADTAGRVQHLAVRVDGAAVDPLVDVTEEVTSTGASTYWAPRKSFAFLADGSTMTLTLADASGAVDPGLRLNSDLLLDDVRVVELVNQPPVADPQSVTLDEDVVTDITLTGSDPNPGDTLAFVIASPPAHGSVDLTDAVATYTPAANYHGTDSFMFHVSDGTFDSANVEVTITVNPVNDPPVAVNDGSVVIPLVTVDEDSGASAPILVLANDSDADLDALTVATATSADGTVEILPGATSVSFTPAADFNGATTISYTISDGNGGMAAATVFVSVTPVNDAPIANAGTATVDEDGTVEITLTGSDVDAGDSLSFAIAGDPTHGTVDLVNDVATYMPNANYNGPDSFTFTVNDGTVASAAAEISVTVTPINDAPIANPGAATVDEDGAVEITLTGSDVDAGDSLSFAIAGDPTHGTVDLVNEVATYTPNADYNGPDSFTFTVNDGTVASAAAEISITVNPVNDPPAVTDDGSPGDPYLTVDEDSGPSAPLEVLANDSDADLDPLTLTAASSPNGAVSILAGDTTLSFAPNENFNGSTTISYTVSDGHGGTADGTAFIEVTPINDAPVVNAGSAVVNEDESVDITLTGNDVDAGDTLSFALVTPPANGTVNIVGNLATYMPVANFNGPDSFTFEASDGLLTSAAKSIEITVNPVNDPPVADDQLVFVDEDNSIPITLTGSDDEGETLSFAVVGGPSHGALQLDGAVATYTPSPDYNGQDFIYFIAFTRTGTTMVSDLATVSITVDPINDAPVALPQAVSIAEDGTAEITLMGSDVDAGDSLSFAITSDPTHGTVDLVNDVATYTPNGNYNGPDSFTFTVNDGTVASAAEIDVTVTPVNDTPIAVDDGSVQTPFLTMVEDSPASDPIPVLTNDTDADDDPLTVATADSPNGTVAINADQTLSFTPAPDFNGVATISYTVFDGTAASLPATVFVEVTPVNDAPIANAGTATVDEDGTVGITLTGSDMDAGDSLSFAITSDPTHGTVDLVNDVATYMPNANYNGPDSFTFTVNDGTVASAVAEISVTVTPVNDAPIANAGTATVDEDGTVGITLTGSDVDAGDSLSFAIASGPTHGTVGLVNEVATYTPNPNYTGPDSFTFTVNDGTVASAAAEIAVTVTPINDAPIANAGTATVDEDGTVEITLTGSDVDAGDSLSFAIASGPTHGTVDLVNEVATYTPNADYNGPDSFTFTVNDGTVASAAAEIAVTVTPINDAPIANAGTATVDEDGTVGITLTGSDVDAGDSLSFAIASGPTHGTVALVNEVATYTPNPNYTGPDSFTFIVNDGTVASAAAEISVTVYPIGGFALVTADPDNDSIDDSYLLFSYRRSDFMNNDPSTSIRVEWSSDLAGSWNDAGETAGVVVLVEDDAAGVGVDLVNVYIPTSLSSGGRLFARLAVTVGGP